MDLKGLIAGNELLSSYCFYVALLTLKMLMMSLLTARQRFKNNAFANVEDTKTTKGAKVRTDENVERVRRAHLNDLENVPLFMIIALVYVTTAPSVALTLWLFRLFVISRYAHTLVYAVVVVPQPARAISWFVGYGITAFMAVKCAIFYM